MALLSQLSFVQAADDVEAKLAQMQAQIDEMRSENEETQMSLIDEMSTLSDEIFSPQGEYESVSSLGMAASKVYHSKSVVSLGGYGEYGFRKFNDYKNTSSAQYNADQNKAQTNVIRFVPYIGFKFNDWIIMNTEIEFEDGGAKTVDDGKNYKYAIVEFSYLDFLFSKELALRVGHILVPFGLTNLNHEPVAYLTVSRPTVETFIIPSTWHTNGALLFGTLFEDFEYYLGTISAPDATRYEEGRFVQLGRRGAKQITDDFGIIGRLQYSVMNGLDVGTSAYYSNTGDAISVTQEALDVPVGMAEIHASYKDKGFDIQTLAVYGKMGDVEALSTQLGKQLSSNVYGAYMTVGYDVLHSFDFTQRVMAVAEYEYLNMDVKDESSAPLQNRFSEYTLGVSYFPDPKVVVKADIWMRDYNSESKLADEHAFEAQIGFIF